MPGARVKTQWNCNHQQQRLEYILAGVMMIGTFGTSSQYPVLKYTDNPNTDSSECRSVGDASTDLPICGSLLSPTLRYGLSELQLVAR